MQNLAEDKQRLRREMLARRRALGAAEAAGASRGLCGRLEAFLERRGLLRSGTLLSYLAYGREASLGPLHERLWRRGCRLAVPRTEGLPPGVMRAVRLEPQTPLHKTSLGVAEPLSEAAEPVEPGELAAALLPGLAFDAAGGRLGHGAGYYDRFLPLLPRGALLIGAAYDWQLLPAGAVPSEPWDRRVDVVVSERRLLICNERIFNVKMPEKTRK